MAKFTGHTITNDSALGDAKIQRSLRFNDADSTYLRKSDFGSPDSGTTFTFSAWVKRTELGTWTTIAGSHSGTNAFNVFGVNSNDQLIWRIRNSSSSDLTRIQSENLLRDTNAWYHLLLERNSTLSTAGDRAKLYINGVRVTEFDQNNTDEEDQTYSSDFLQDINIGRFQVSSSQVYYGGMYLAEYHYVDGQALDPSYFGFTDPVTGAWMPKRYEGTHGTNGFYLDFSDNSSTTALGIDKSPNGNDFTPNNFSIAAGKENDSLEDAPSNNFCTMNPLMMNQTEVAGTHSNGNLTWNADNNYATTQATFSVKHGKWYWECEMESQYVNIAGITRGTRAAENTYIGYDTNGNLFGFGYYYNDGTVKGTTDGLGTTSNNNLATSQTTAANGDILGIASDIANGYLIFYKNGTHIYTITGINNTFEWMPSFSAYGTSAIWHVNFGQRPFSYTPPAGHKSLCSKNMPPTTSIVRPQKHFEALLYTGNGSTQSITGLEFKPDFVWLKRRNGTNSHQLYDVVRGAGKNLRADLTNAEVDVDHFDSFDSDGFSLVGGTNAHNSSGNTYVAWCWKAGGTAVTNNDGSIASSVSANQEAGFSIVVYTGNGSAGGGGTIGHGLGKTPNIMFVKNRADASNWSGNGNAGGRLIYGTNKIYLHSGAGLLNDTNEVTAATSTTFTVTDSGATNGQNDSHVAYCWTEIPGFSKFDKYVGNGNSNGTYVYLGFRPACIFIFNTSTTTGHTVFDNKRSPVNHVDEFILPSALNAESSGANEIDFLSNGFKHRSGDNKVNSGGKIYVYMAFAEQPNATPFDTFANGR